MLDDAEEHRFSYSLMTTGKRRLAMAFRCYHYRNKQRNKTMEKPQFKLSHSVGPTGIKYVTNNIVAPIRRRITFTLKNAGLEFNPNISDITLEQLARNPSIALDAARYARKVFPKIAPQPTKG